MRGSILSLRSPYVIERVKVALRIQTTPCGGQEVFLMHANSAFVGAVLVSSVLFTGCDSGGGSTEDFVAIFPDAENDDDEDGLMNGTEVTGWDIVVDFEGYGTDSLTEIHVTSLRALPDTDFDGLDDAMEYELRTDPTNPDTDSDGLLDFDEVFIWLSNPTTVDTDGDSRGPSGSGTPNARLFDGNETRLLCTGEDPGDICLHLGTSPTLADTDGDGLTDAEEFDDPFRSPLISDLPLVGLDLVGEIDIRLNVEYAETIGQEHQYGTTEIDTTTTVNRTTTSDTHTVGGSYSLELTLEGEAGFFPPSGKVRTGANHTFGVHYDYTHTSADETGTDTVDGTEEIDYYTDSHTRTETASSGTVSVGIALRNRGLYAVEVEDFGLSVLMREPSLQEAGEESFKTLATLLPEISSVVLAPGEATESIRVSSADVNTDLIKQFLAAPTNLIFRPTSFKMKGENGIDFDFLTENTVTRTALVEIDFGGEDVRIHRVATNVQRGPGGTYEGITMREVMQDVLGLAYTTQIQLQDGLPTGREVLSSIEGVSTVFPAPGEYPQSFWFLDVVFNDPNNPQLAAFDSSDFDDIILRASDEIRLIYWLDGDNDGLSETLEMYLGTDTEGERGSDPKDTDGDGLSDREEAVEGWIAGWPGGVDPNDGSSPTLQLFGYPKLVISDPRLVDTDGDGLADEDERLAGTDPRHVDTDRDGVEDGRDLCPLERASILRVDPDSPNDGPGLAADWSDAYHSLQSALNSTRAVNQDGLCNNDVAEIWVASGSYQPDPVDRNIPFVPVDGVSIYGGFAGFSTSGRPGETKLGQRNPDPFTNGTTLTGDLMGNDDPDSISITEPTRQDNSFHVIEVLDPGFYVIDGFTVTGGNASGSFPDSTSFGGGVKASVGNTDTQLRNLLLIANSANDGGGVEGRSIRVLNSTFVNNHAADRGGGFTGFGSTSGSASIEGCRFLDNTAQWGGGAFLNNTNDPGANAWFVSDCTFISNDSTQGGAGVYSASSSAGATWTTVQRSHFRDNTTTQHGGGILNAAGGLNVNNSVFYNNLATRGGGIDGHGGNSITNVVNCTISRNEGTLSAGGVHVELSGEIKLSNTIVWANIAPGSGQQEELGGSGLLTAESCCIEEIATLAGNNNISQNPEFVDFSGGVLRLTGDSPCIDAGNQFVDTDLYEPGFQFLSIFDFDLNLRFIDGDGDGNATVDIGAYENIPGF